MSASSYGKNKKGKTPQSFGVFHWYFIYVCTYACMHPLHPHHADPAHARHSLVQEMLVLPISDMSDLGQSLTSKPQRPFGKWENSIYLPKVLMDSYAGRETS